MLSSVKRCLVVGEKLLLHGPPSANRLRQPVVYRLEPRYNAGTMQRLNAAINRMIDFLGDLDGILVGVPPIGRDTPKFLAAVNAMLDKALDSLGDIDGLIVGVPRPRHK